MSFLPNKRFDHGSVSYKAISYLIIGLLLLIYSPFAFFGGVLALMFSGASGTGESVLLGVSHLLLGIFIPIWGAMFFVKATRLFRRIETPPASLTKKIIIAAVFIVPIAFYLLVPQLSPVLSGKNESDSRRISDIRQIALALENHYDELGFYPDRLDALKPDYYSGLTFDIESAMSYLYKSASCPVPNKSYVVGAILKDNNNPVLQSSEDADGIICGADCNDTPNNRYCITNESF